MKKLLLIFLLFSFSAQAKIADNPLKGFTKKELMDIYDKQMKSIPDSEKIFIQAKTPYCRTIKGAKNLRNLSLNGHRLYEKHASRNGCDVTKGHKHALVVYNDKNFMYLLGVNITKESFSVYGSDEVTTKTTRKIFHGWVDKSTLMTLQQRKNLDN